MFKKRAVQLTFVPKPEKAEKADTGKDDILNPEMVKLITERTKDVVRFVALAAIGTYAALVAIDTVSQIAIKKTKSADNE